MRIVHISDIHLSAENLIELRNFYIAALVNDLENYHKEKQIDIILLTGDLINRSGNDLGKTPYKTFEKEFIDPIVTRLGISKEKFLFIPGNHDIDIGKVDDESEFYWSNQATVKTINQKTLELRNKFDSLNKRVEKFKKFESNFHSQNDRYKFSNFESLSVEKFGNWKIGFALLNDSWRCSPQLPEGRLFMGTSQLFNAKNYFNLHETDLNIAVFHHPIDSFNEAEAQEIESIIKSFQFQIVVSGHVHKTKFEIRFSSMGGYMILGGRAAFNDPNEMDTNYQPGYTILDLAVPEKKYTVNARKFIKLGGYRFDKDVDSLKDGMETGSYAKSENYHTLYEAGGQKLNDLPSGYKADVEKVVSLLIGKSLYPDPLVFVRELIQNSVDACDRKRRTDSSLEPKIVVHFNSAEGFLEVNDQGDGMTKAVLLNHFAVVGRSISQEINESNGQFDLISKFGIGFISTFIAGSKVIVSTKTQQDGLITFEIKNVFKDFNYLDVHDHIFLEKVETGTSIRVYLKNEYKNSDLLSVARKYCRHISNIEFYRDSIRQEFAETWNAEKGYYLVDVKNTKYQLKLSFSNESGLIIASNSGFLISEYPQNIIPVNFPANLIGEINFAPKSIDFDLSRANIIVSEKSREVRKQISVYLRFFFRKAIEDRNQDLIQLVVQYLQFYLVTFEKYQNQVSESYVDFYSVDELVRLCADNVRQPYESREESLSNIFSELRQLKITKIYYMNAQPRTDLEIAIYNYLQDKGNFVVVNSKSYVNFRTQQESFNIVQSLQIIATTAGFTMIDIGNDLYTILEEMKSTNINIEGKLNDVIFRLQQMENISIRIAELGSIEKAFIKYSSFFFINRHNPSFSELNRMSDNLPIEVLDVYIRGMLGLPVRL